MILSSRGDGSGPAICRCKNRAFHVHGNYFRTIARVVVYRFRCTACLLTISMLPNTCVPYKQYPVTIMNPVLEGMFLHDRSGRYYERTDPHGIHASTAHRWRNEFEQHSSTLATEAAHRIKIATLLGTGAGVYRQLKQHFANQCADFFRPLQLALCRKYPPLGIFRILHS